MFHAEQFLLTSSLILNGFWVGAQLIKRAGGSSHRLGLTILALFGASLLLYNPPYIAWSQSIAFSATKALAFLLPLAGMWCFGEWAKLQPAPWGEEPRRKKTRVR